MVQLFYQVLKNTARLYLFNITLILVLLFNYTHGFSGKKFEIEVPIRPGYQVIKHYFYHFNPCMLDISQNIKFPDILALYYPVMLIDRQDNVEPVNEYDLVPMDREIKLKRRRSTVWS